MKGGLDNSPQSSRIPPDFYTFIRRNALRLLSPYSPRSHSWYGCTAEVASPALFPGVTV